MTAATSSEESATTVSIRPGVGVIGLFPYMNYKPWYALAELVDNALASFLQSRERLAVDGRPPKLTVTIEVSPQDGGRIRVWDNAAGIATADYRRAFVSAEPPPDATGLSQFGIGMKSASCWFARRWSVRSTALDEPIERFIEIDVPSIVEGGIEEVSAVERVAQTDMHYTEVTLWDLHKPPQSRTITKMADHLASIYRVFLMRGELEIRFNGDELSYEHPRVLTAAPYGQDEADSVEWTKPVAFTLPTGESVTGFAAIRETASVPRAGFALFRNDRLIVGSDDETYRPPEIFGASNRFRYQRVFGELHLSGFDVSHTKDGFIWGDREEQFLASLRRELDSDDMPLLRQAENYRARKPNARQRQASAKALDNTAQAIEESGPALTAQVHGLHGEDGLPTEQHPVAELETRALQVTVGSETWEIMIELSIDEPHADWLTISSSSDAGNRPRTLDIRVSLAHPFMMQFGGTTAADIEPLLRLAAAMALAEITARESGVRQAGAVRRNVNDLLRSALARP